VLGRIPNHAAGIQRILHGAARIPLVPNARLLASVNVVLRNLGVPQLLGRLDDGGRQPGLEVPLDVAVEQVHARVVGLEPQHRVRLGHHHDGVAPGRYRVVLVVGERGAGPVARSGGGSAQNLEVVAVQVEGVGDKVVVVDDNVDNVAVRDDEGVHTAVDGWVGVVLAGCDDGVESWDLGRYIWQPVDIRSRSG